MRARYYNVDIKRFINQDVVIGSIDSSMSLNRYAYVEGNPVNFLGPFGLNRIDTQNYHMIAASLEIVGGTLSKYGMVQVGAILTAMGSGFDFGVSFYDVYYNIIDSDWIALFASIGGMALDIIGLVTAGISNSLLNQAEFIARVEGRVTNYEEVLIYAASEYDYLSNVSNVGNYLSLLNGAMKKMYKFLKEVIQGE